MLQALLHSVAVVAVYCCGSILLCEYHLWRAFSAPAPAKAATGWTLWCFWC